MSGADNPIKSESLDDLTEVIYLQIPPEKVVIAQGLIESYEGLSVVRTSNPELSIISLIFTKDMRQTVIEFLNGSKDLLNWQQTN
ncbi:MAG TPA: DUF4911 domain-containing protein [Oligoflexia bacterium]|nr:DUF4911 domain-containing protein [Oligoflexia bacterium]HMP27521.1 DUF4911 domain-containing protein [Oligoflexia bacterium]